MGIIRRTKSVAAVLDAFQTHRKLGAISVIELIEQLGTRFNKTTIYRVLDKLEEDGVLHSFLGKNGLKWYAKCTGCSAEHHEDLHPHFQCLVCGKVDCLNTQLKLPVLPNKSIEMSQLLIQGKCEQCLD